MAITSLFRYQTQVIHILPNSENFLMHAILSVKYTCRIVKYTLDAIAGSGQHRGAIVARSVDVDVGSNLICQMYTDMIASDLNIEVP